MASDHLTKLNTTVIVKHFTTSECAKVLYTKERTAKANKSTMIADKSIFELGCCFQIIACSIFFAPGSLFFLFAL